MNEQRFVVCFGEAFDPTIGAQQQPYRQRVIVSFCQTNLHK